AIDTGCGMTGVTTISFIATDECGNSVSTQASFTIVDTTAPELEEPAKDVVVECDGTGNMEDLMGWLDSNGGAIAKDLCSGADITWTNDFTGLSDECGSTGSATVTFVATDACGNTVSTTASFTIVDTTAPVITVVASDMVVECDGQGNQAALDSWLNSHAGAQAEDLCGIVTWTHDFSGLSDDCGATGSATVTFTASDECGNSSSTTATFSIVDTVAPVFVETLPEDVRMECDETIPAAITLTAVDQCSNAEVTFSEEIVDQQCDNTYTIVRVWTATDACGNSVSHTQRIFIEDTTAPIFVSNLPEDMYLNCDSIPQAPVLEAVDNCGEVTVTLEEYEEPGDCSSKYQLVRVWTATDGCGNSTVHQQVLYLSCEIEVYNAVSTIDSRNYFKLEGIDCYPNNKVKIFNRWGVLVYEVDGYNNADKSFKGYSEGRATLNDGQMLPTGTYFYILEYEFSLDGVNSEILEQSGYLYLNSSK